MDRQHCNHHQESETFQNYVKSVMISSYLHFRLRQTDVLDARYEGKCLRVCEIFILRVKAKSRSNIGLQLSTSHQVGDQIEPESNSSRPELVLHSCLQT